MPAYLITKSSSDALETIVFEAGEGGKDEAIAVFTDAQPAEIYIKEAGWDSEFTVAKLETIPFLHWLLKVHHDGVEHLVINPSRAEQEDGSRLNTLNVAAHLEHAASHILQVARPDF